MGGLSDIDMEVSLLRVVQEERRVASLRREERTNRSPEKGGEESKEAIPPTPFEERRNAPQEEKVEPPPSPKESVSKESAKDEGSSPPPSFQTEVKTLPLNSLPSPTGEAEKGRNDEAPFERGTVASLRNLVPSNGSTGPSDGVTKVSPSLPPSDPVFIQPRYAINPKPHYPQEAKRRGYEGEVLLRVEVLSNGQVGEVEVKRSSGYESLDRSAITAVREWRFIPARKGETPVSVWVTIPVVFQLR